jgi:hypothetical protein
MEQIHGSETSACKNQTPGIHPKDYSQTQTKLLLRTFLQFAVTSFFVSPLTTLWYNVSYRGYLRQILNLLWLQHLHLHGGVRRNREQSRMCGAGVSRDTGVLAYWPWWDLWIHFNPVTWFLQSLECKIFIFDKRRCYLLQVPRRCCIAFSWTGSKILWVSQYRNTHSSQYTQGLYRAVICQYIFVKQFVPDLKGALIWNNICPIAVNFKPLVEIFLNPLQVLFISIDYGCLLPVVWAFRLHNHRSEE